MAKISKEDKKIILDAARDEVKKLARETLLAHGITLDYLARKLKEGLNAKVTKTKHFKEVRVVEKGSGKTKTVTHEPIDKWSYSKNLRDHTNRIKAIQLAYEILGGHQNKTTHEIDLPKGRVLVIDTRTEEEVRKDVDNQKS